MTGLNDIIASFSLEERQQFVQFLQKKNKRNDTKNVQLFQLLLAGELTSEEIATKIYNKNNKDALYALRKRLYQSVIDFTANHAMEDEVSTDMQVAKYLLAARSYLAKTHYQTAYKILDKAESIAQEQQLFTMLNEIYHTKIQYAHKQPNLDLDQLIEKFKQNQTLYELDEELNLAYAKIRKAIREVTYEGRIVNFQELVEGIFDEHNISLNETLSFKSVYQLITIVSISAFASKDYYKIESFLLSTYAVLKEHKSKDRQLVYHIHVVYAIANTLFRNKKFDASQQYLQIMHELMLSKRRKYYNLFRLKYHLLLGLNQNYSGNQDQAIENLEQFVQKSHPDLSTLLEVYLSLIMCYFQKGAFKQAMRLFANFYHTDKWYIQKVGQEWTLKKNLIEILLHLELGNIDFFESRLLSFKRSYYDYLKKIGQERAIVYLSLVEEYYKDPSQVTSEAFYNKVENSFEWIAAAYEDIFVMSFYAWLKSKMDNRDLYRTTLDLVKRSHI
jgi:tetratricopeptide (TPR) repeat protein